MTAETFIIFLPGFIYVCLLWDHFYHYNLFHIIMVIPSKWLYSDEKMNTNPCTTTRPDIIQSAALLRDFYIILFSWSSDIDNYKVIAHVLSYMQDFNRCSVSAVCETSCSQQYILHSKPC